MHELLLERPRQRARPEPAHLRGPGMLAGGLLLDHAVENLDLFLSEIPNDKVQLMRLFRPAVQTGGHFLHQLRAERAVHVVVVERPQFVGAHQAAPRGRLVEG